MASFRKEINCGSDGSFQGSLGFEGIIRSMFFVSMVDPGDGAGPVGSRLRNTNIDEMKFENQTIVENYASGVVEENNWFDETYSVSENTRIKVRFSKIDDSKALPQLRAVFIYEDPKYPDSFSKDPAIAKEMKEIKSRTR